jgi:hypothetical protein
MLGTDRLAYLKGVTMHRILRRILLIAAALALLLVPAAAIAAGGFVDVADDSVFIADIQWMKDAGITKGCNPPTNDMFCPASNVTRQQMAAFMHRLAASRVVDAKTALDADKLDGVDSGGFLPDGTPPVGTTARGNYTLGSDGSRDMTSINWGFEMPSSPTVRFLVYGSAPTTDCPGTAVDPRAAAGYLCVYEASSDSCTGQFIFSGGNGGANRADVFGASIIGYNSGAGEFGSFGTWAITVGAP